MTECIQDYVDDKPTVACGCIKCWPESQGYPEIPIKWKNDLLIHYIESIANILYHEMPLKEQDLWLQDMIVLGLFTVGEEE